MFVRTINQVNGKVTVAIVENTRDASGKVCQKILRRIATVFPHELSHLKDLAEHAKSEMEEERQARLFPAKDLADMVSESRKASEYDDKPLLVNLKKLYEEKRLVTGIHEIYGSLFDEGGLSNVLHGCVVSKKVMKDVVMARLAKPCSKRSPSELLERDFGITIPLEKIYRMMNPLPIESTSCKIFAGNIQKHFSQRKLRLCFTIALRCILRVLPKMSCSVLAIAKTTNLIKEKFCWH